MSDMNGTDWAREGQAMRNASGTARLREGQAMRNMAWPERGTR